MVLSPLFLLVSLPLVLVLASQQAFTRPYPEPYPEPFDNSTAPFIFNSLSSLLVQWPNTYHGNGHTVIPGILEPYTLLYHARKDANVPPPSPEWFAFDPEMSYGIMGGRGGETFLLTYRNIRPARIVYFDGMSAALNDAGWLDSQEVLIKNTTSGSNDTTYPVPWNEYLRATKLCKWGKDFGVDGFVRMNAGFELMWCDFNSPAIQLVSHLNITAPDAPPRVPDPPPGPPNDGPAGHVQDPPTAPTRRRPRPGPSGLSPLGISSIGEWLRAASQRGMSPQPHVILDYASFVTFYHPRLRSLAPAREGQTMRQHRIWPNISGADAQSVLDEVEEVLQRPPWRRAGSGMDWGALARNVVEEWASRIVQLREFLGNASVALEEGAAINATETVATVRRLTYSPLNPFMDTRAASNSSAWDWLFDPSSPSVDVFAEQYPPHGPPPIPPHPAANANTSALRRCMYSATGFLNDPRIHKTPQETLLQTTVETVLQRLCSDYGAIFVESMDTDDHASKQSVKELIAKWEALIVSLMEWLDWTEWHRCNEVCPRDSVCTVPMWPVNWFTWTGEERDDPNGWMPRCISLVPQFREGPGRRRIVEALLDARESDHHEP